MTIKIKLRPDHKAIIRFKDDSEMNFFRFVMTRMRDDPMKNHPPVSIKTPDNKEVPKLPEMKPPIINQPNQVGPVEQKPETPVMVQATPIQIETKPEIRYYTNEDLF